MNQLLIKENSNTPLNFKKLIFLVIFQFKESK